jgi:hypothetical protein
MDAEFARLVARRGDDAAFAGTAHGDGLAAQFWIVPLFNGRVKGVHIDVNDLALPRRRRCGFLVPRLITVHLDHRHTLRILAPTSMRTSLASCRLPATVVASGQATHSKCCRSAAGMKRVRDAQTCRSPCAFWPCVKKRCGTTCADHRQGLASLRERGNPRPNRDAEDQVRGLPANHAQPLRPRRGRRAHGTGRDLPGAAESAVSDDEGRPPPGRNDFGIEFGRYGRCGTAPARLLKGKCAPGAPMKKIGRSDIIGQRGMAHIEGVVLSMDFMFYPTGGVEAGIDGFIEIRDKETGAVGNLLLQVQGKATERQRLQAETEDIFEFPAPRRTSATGCTGRRRSSSSSSIWNRASPTGSRSRRGSPIPTG